MKEKILIAGGCSFSDSKRKNYVENNILAWPTIMGLDGERLIIDVSSYGASNCLIENKVFDAIQQYRKDYDVVVMVLWTDMYRINLADDWQHKTFFPREYGTEDKPLDWHKKMWEKFFRSMRRTKLLCQHYGIPWHFRNGACCNPIKNNGQLLNEIKDWLKTHPIQKEVHMSWMEILYGCTSSFTEEFWMSKQDMHPNQAGQNRIAKMFETGKCEPIVERSKAMEFIYD